TISDMLAAVLKEEPDLTRAPAIVRRLLQSCLQKDPKQRLQAIGDARLLLDEGPTATPEAMSRLPWAIAGVFAVAAPPALLAPSRRAAPDRLQLAMQLDLDVGAAMSPNNVGPDAILSPDGGRLVFVVQGSTEKARLVTRRVDQSQSVE